MRFSYFFLILSAVAYVTSICRAAEQPTPPRWTYDDDYTGQEDWGMIKGYEICGSGVNQSPVVISYTKTITGNNPLDFKYKQASGKLKLTKKSFIMEIADGGAVIDNGKTYTLQTIEIHSPSGHRVRNDFYPAEIHLIHKNNDGNLLIVAAFVGIGNENSAMETIIKQADSNNREKFTLDSSALTPTVKSYYAYNGSLPYPPCAENVQWRIIKTPITISHDQLSRLVKHTGRNSRLPQPLYIREVLEID